MTTRNAPPSSVDSYEPIRRAIRAEQTDIAREMLRPILTNAPTAEAWYLASQIADSPAQTVNFLRRALALDANHEAARRSLLLLEGTKKSVTAIPNLVPADGRTMVAGSKAVGRPSEKQSSSVSKIVFIVFFVVLIGAVAAFALDAVGVVQGLITGVTVVSGGPTPIAEIGGVPFAQASSAAAVAPAAQSKPASSRDADVIENGYLHEYRFVATTPQDISVNIKFYSLAAKNVAANVAVVAPDGSDLLPRCTPTGFGDASSVNVVCHVINAGTYLVRVLGRSGQSVGAYTIGVQRPE